MIVDVKHGLRAESDGEAQRWIGAQELGWALILLGRPANRAIMTALLGGA